MDPSAMLVVNSSSPRDDIASMCEARPLVGTVPMTLPVAKIDEEHRAAHLRRHREQRVAGEKRHAVRPSIVPEVDRPRDGEPARRRSR